MKKYIVFLISFLLLFVVFQFVSGMLVTLVYTPDIQAAWQMTPGLSQETVVASNQLPIVSTFIITSLAASIAYFMPKLFFKTK